MIRTQLGLTLFILALTAGSALAQGSARAALTRPFERLADSGPGGVVELAFDARDVAELAQLAAEGQGFRLRGLPLPGGIEIDLDLRPTSALAPDATAQVVHEDGSVSALAPSVSCFTGYGPDGSEAFLGLRADGLDGYVSLGGQLYFLSSGGSPRGRATLAHAAAIGGSTSSALRQFCQIAGGPRALALDTTELLALPTLKEADVWIECDLAFRQLFASDQACIDYATLLITAASEIFRRDLGVELLIPSGYLRVWNSLAPWGVITTFSDLNNVQAWWTSAANPDRDQPRSSVHVLTTPAFGGVAWLPGICDNFYGYQISGVVGHFPYPIDHTNNDNWDLFVVCHEFGHAFGCQHSFDFVPPIECRDGSGPDSGTIMSYCHGLLFGVGGVGMRFHEREQQTIRAHVATRGCIRSRTLLNGDYDGDGARDLDDLAAANALLGRGFRSLGAEESLDMDADLDFDSLDRDLLAASIGAPPASVTERNGSGVNVGCYFQLNNPVLGTDWETQIGALGVGRPTFLLVYDQPHPGLLTGFGEMLVLPVGLGGTKLLVHRAASDGVFATHVLPIPPDPALVGISAATQGFVLGGPGGSRFCNALDLVLGFDE